MDFVRFIFKVIKPKKNKNAAEKTSSAIHNPVTNQTSTISNDPKFITHIHHYHTSQGAPGSSTIGPALVTTSYDAEQTGTSGTQSISFATSATNADLSVEWIKAKPENADELSDKAVVGGYDYEGSSLWVIRTRLGGELLPGKLNIVSKGAYAAWHLDEVMIGVFEVCCVPKHKVKWVEASKGAVPTNAIEGGRTSNGEKLYIGRATYDRSLIPGKIQPSHECCYVTYAFKAHSFQNYEVLCVV